MIGDGVFVLMTGELVDGVELRLSILSSLGRVELLLVSAVCGVA